MRLSTAATVITASLALTHAASAVTVRLSDSNTDPDNPLDTVLTVGDSRSLYIWVDLEPNEQVLGINLDINSSASSVLEATGITIFNPDIDLASAGLGPTGTAPRWANSGFGPNEPGSLGDLVDNHNSVAIPVPGSGAFESYGLVQSAAGGADQGTVVGNSFLYGEVSFTGTAAGTTDVTPGIDEFRNGVEIDPEDEIDGNNLVQPFGFVGGSVTVVPDFLAGDANLDGRVDFSDFSILSGSFGDSDTEWNTGDFNGDGVTDFADFSILSGNFGNDDTPVAVTAVPEPTSLALLGVAGLMVVRRRRG